MRLALTIVLLASLPAAGARASDAAWTGEATLISGTSRYDAGEWIHTDFVYDDYGADTVPGGQPNAVSLASTTGDFRYPNGTTEAGNAADIVEVRARADGDDLDVRVLLQSIVGASIPAVWVSVDGVESVFSKDNAGVDADANTISFTIPGAASGDTLELNIGAGLNDGEGGLRAGETGYAQANASAFTTGGATDNRLFDLAFNTRDIEGRGGAWNENVQSAWLQSGDLGAFVQTVDIAALRDGTTTPVPEQPGYSVRIFHSRQDLGEGMSSSFPQYRGRWQPYAVWVPSGYDGSAAVPLFLNMHSLSVHHNQYRGGSSPSASYRTLYEQFDEAIGAVVVTPLARGPDGWYQDEGLIDTLEVWADARARYATDPERTVVGGYSMGGFGTYRLATLMPDSFASAVSIVGPPGDGIWAYPLPPTGGADDPVFTHPQLENTLHVPFWITQGVLDELVPFLGVTQQAQRFAELGHEYRFALHPVADHFAFAFQDDYRREAAWFASHLTRVTDPGRVTLKVRPAGWGSDGTILSHLDAVTAELGARVDGAYWVGDVTVADGDDVTGVVDLTSRGITREGIGAAAILPTVGIDGPSPHLLTGQDRLFAENDAGDTIDGYLADVTALTVDVGRAGLSDAPDVSLIGLADGTSPTITFVRDGVTVGQAQLG